jgi:hypothetical protein
MHQAFEEVFAGRAPDERRAACDVHAFDGFSFWLPAGFDPKGEVRA